MAQWYLTATGLVGGMNTLVYPYGLKLEKDVKLIHLWRIIFNSVDALMVFDSADIDDFLCKSDTVIAVMIYEGIYKI